MPLKPDFHPPVRIDNYRHRIPVQQRLVQGILTLVHPPLLILNPLPTPRVAQPIRRRSHRQSIDHRNLGHSSPSRQISRQSPIPATCCHHSPENRPFPESRHSHKNGKQCPPILQRPTPYVIPPFPHIIPAYSPIVIPPFPYVIPPFPYVIPPFPHVIPSVAEESRRHSINPPQDRQPPLP